MRGTKGFSLVELMIAVAIMGVLLALGVPAFTTYLSNVRLRSAADTFLSSVELAKATAASTNARTEILLTNTTAPAALATAVASTTGSGWMVRAADLSRFVEGKSLIEGGRGTQAVVAINGSVGSVIFTPLGGTSLAATATFAFSNPEGGACAPAGPIRCLNVMVAATGRVKLCDPAAPAGDTRECA